MTQSELLHLQCACVSYVFYVPSAGEPACYSAAILAPSQGGNDLLAGLLKVLVTKMDAGGLLMYMYMYIELNYIYTAYSLSHLSTRLYPEVIHYCVAQGVHDY